jgi:hypothetical protein
MMELFLQVENLQALIMMMIKVFLQGEFNGTNSVDDHHENLLPSEEFNGIFSDIGEY